MCRDYLLILLSAPNVITAEKKIFAQKKENCNEVFFIDMFLEICYLPINIIIGK